MCKKQIFWCLTLSIKIEFNLLKENGQSLQLEYMYLIFLLMFFAVQLTL